MITLLTRQDMAKVFTMAEAVQAAKDALALYSAGDTDIPLRANLPSRIEAMSFSEPRR
mgnify:CR=1 FL=1